MIKARSCLRDLKVVLRYYRNLRIREALKLFGILINAEKEDFPLIVGWLLMALRGKGPFPVLVIQGEQGTGKSMTSKMIRKLIDPSTVLLRALPKEERDLLVSASNS